MNGFRLESGDVVGLVHAFVDAHTLGLNSVAQLLRDSGYKAEIAGAEVRRSVEGPSNVKNVQVLRRWIEDNQVSHLGFSYRLDPGSAREAFSRLVHVLRDQKLLQESGGPIRGLYFAGLPAACEKVLDDHGERVQVFRGDETPRETLTALGVPVRRIPRELEAEEQYDRARMAFGESLLERGLPDRFLPAERSTYAAFGTRQDTLAARLNHARDRLSPPLMRAHVGPYGPDRKAAVNEFLHWCRRLAWTGYLDVLSIGTSQLTQSHFGMDWGGMPNGGGVPINSEDEYRQVYDSAHPMLVRTYAGTADVPALARVHENCLNIAWHALSFWWFSEIDGRGPNSVAENLRQHFETLRYVAETGKPFEANIPHHFAFRGADDATYVASTVLAARCAKRLGVGIYVFQNMLNTPRWTWGLQDLAKARVALALLRELEDDGFRVVYQPRAGLDYLSSDPAKARVQLGAVSALMDDVEPDNPGSPEVVHVVSYSEGYELADPNVIDESIRITQAAIQEYRRLRELRMTPDVSRSTELMERTVSLDREVRVLLEGMKSSIPDLYTPSGMYRVFWSGFFPTPYLWECRDEFEHAIAWQTAPIRGATRVVDGNRQPIAIEDRVAVASEVARSASALAAAKSFGAGLM